MKIHFLGICGIAMGAIAIELKRQGHEVSGSDKGFYPPMSTALENADIKIMVGFKEEHIDIDNLPELFVVGNAIAADNVELLKAKSTGVKILNYPEVLAQFVIKNDSLVISGTYGKSTISSMIIKIFKELKIPVSYMTGAQSIDIENSVQIENSKFSVVEGDEYPAEKGGKSKFFYYSPKYFVVTSCEWDHTDIFLTESDYIINFQNIVKEIPEDGILFLNSNGKNLDKLADVAKCKVIWIDTEKKIQGLNLKMIGKHNYINAIIAIQVFQTLQLEIEIEKVIEVLNNFRGVKRRVEVKYQDSKVMIIDDFAHNPSKFKSAIDSVAEHFENRCEIIAVVEPNMGNRTKIILDQYKDTFSNPNLVKIIVPRWRVNNLKEDSHLASEEQFASKVNQLNRNDNCEVNFNDEQVFDELVEFLQNANSHKRIVLFMGPEPFRGLIDNLTKFFVK